MIFIYIYDCSSQKSDIIFSFTESSKKVAVAKRIRIRKAPKATNQRGIPREVVVIGATDTGGLKFWVKFPGENEPRYVSNEDMLRECNGTM